LAEVQALKWLLDEEDDAAIWNCYKPRHPRRMKLVQSRENLVAGVRQAYEEDFYRGSFLQSRPGTRLTLSIARSSHTV
jgi:hypothetical protein